ncbi:MAG: hypothetical protein ACR2J5_00400 [Geodermatophilaceae bacterium]
METAEGIFAELDPFRFPPGTNLLPTVYTDVFDSLGHEVPNTLPCTPRDPYHLHDGDPVVTEIDPTSPTDDLRLVFNRVVELVSGRDAHGYWADYGDCTQPDAVGQPLPADQVDEAEVARQLRLGIDILEGNPVAGRAYSGFPLLHYKGPRKVKTVRPTQDGLGKIIGGNVDVHQVWYDSHIESDTAFLDLSRLKDSSGKFIDVPWTVTYTIDVLSRGNDDFSPMTMYFDDPACQPPKPADAPGQEGGHQPLAQAAAPAPAPPLPNVAMDQTFLPMKEGTRTVVAVKMAPPKYFNLTYSWGWRQHPPRAQVMENAGKKFPPQPPAGQPPKFLPDYEKEVFGGKSTVDAIAMISDLSPAKRMWTALRGALEAVVVVGGGTADLPQCLKSVNAAWCSLLEWRDRNHLPTGVDVDHETDLTLLYVNNTIYGQLSDGGWIDFPQWRTRPTTLKVTLLNGDYFTHGYMNVDFGGLRGWENQFKSSVKIAGTGATFTFGRFYWSMNMAMPVILEPATRDNGTTRLSRHKVHITYNFEPSRRLRCYQFDPLHHDVAIYSLH